MQSGSTEAHLKRRTTCRCSQHTTILSPVFDLTLNFLIRIISFSMLTYQVTMCVSSTCLISRSCTLRCGDIFWSHTQECSNITTFTRPQNCRLLPTALCAFFRFLASYVQSKFRPIQLALILCNFTHPFTMNERTHSTRLASASCPEQEHAQRVSVPCCFIQNNIMSELLHSVEFMAHNSVGTITDRRLAIPLRN